MQASSVEIFKLSLQKFINFEKTRDEEEINLVFWMSMEIIVG